jgi:hypothetical protein
VHRGERGGGTTAAAVVLGCALVGAVAGYATSYASHQEPAEGPSAVPLAATSPSVPTNSPVHVVPDSDDYPPLETNLTYVTQFISQASARWQYDAPSGWEPHETSSGVRWTLPENPEHTYSMRVVPVSVPITTRNLARYRFQAVRESPELEAVDLKSIDEHSVTFTYVVDQHLTYQHSYWISKTDSEIGVFEITVSGRLRDEPGLDELLDHVLGSTHRVS